ncbi:MAG: hypothetical protein R3C19_23305 [Planctomycetaceae bacterium]
MKGLLIPIAFALGTAICWGLYGPTLTKARAPAGEWSPFKPYVFIGVAYLAWAIGGGLVAMKLKGDSFSYGGASFPAMNWGFWAGTLGALGALSLTNAVIASKGNTALVMPIVFGGAVTVNGIYAWLKLKDLVDVNPALWVGMALVTVGIVLVAMFTPHGVPARKPAEAAEHVSTDPTDSQPSSNADRPGDGSSA